MVVTATEDEFEPGTVFFDPETGWCVFDRSQGILLANPATVEEHRLEGSLAEAFRGALKRGSALPDAYGEMFPTDGNTLQEALQSGRFFGDPSPTEVLGLRDPRQLWIEVQGSCNEQCVHCYAESAPRDLPSLDSRTVERTVRDAAELDFSLIQFTGGDPLLWDDLPEMVELATEQGLQSEVYTNGLLLDEELYGDLARYDTQFAFSFYSHEPEVHDAITQHSGSWERTLEAIERALDGPTPVRIGVVMMEENQGQRNDIFDFLRDRGLSEEQISFAYTQTVGRGHSLESSGARSISSPKNGSSGAPDENGSSGHMSGVRKSFNPGKLCVSYRGEVIPCIFQRDLTLGSIHEQSLREIVRQPTLRRTSEALTQNHDQPHDPDRLSCSECRFHAFVLHYLVGDRTEDGILPMEGVVDG